MCGMVGRLACRQVGSGQVGTIGTGACAGSPGLGAPAGCCCCCRVLSAAGWSLLAIEAGMELFVGVEESVVSEGSDRTCWEQTVCPQCRVVGATKGAGGSQAGHCRSGPNVWIGSNTPPSASSLGSGTSSVRELELAAIVMCCAGETNEKLELMSVLAVVEAAVV